MSKNVFLNQMTKSLNLTEVPNGAIMNKSTLNSLLDLFGRIGSLRQCSEDEITTLFDRAYKEDSLRAIKCVFYAGDILEGQGERRTFRILMKHIAINYTQALKNNLNLIPGLNRWDSIYALFDTPLEEAAIGLI